MISAAVIAKLMIGYSRGASTVDAYLNLRRNTIKVSAAAAIIKV